MDGTHNSVLCFSSVCVDISKSKTGVYSVHGIGIVTQKEILNVLDSGFWNKVEHVEMKLWKYLRA